MAATLAITIAISPATSSVPVQTFSYIYTPATLHDLIKVPFPMTQSFTNSELPAAGQYNIRVKKITTLPSNLVGGTATGIDTLKNSLIKVLVDLDVNYT